MNIWICIVLSILKPCYGEEAAPQEPAPQEPTVEQPGETNRAHLVFPYKLDDKFETETLDWKLYVFVPLRLSNSGGHT
ncbi:hypothetical protein GCK32_015868 [Trichostrongylus colubriformis]|uniref:Uncharacterized protein n=1 Tax=Trichostrongylus colubriformis TaxID=6319 RepID=A0AAN8J2M2_TRICO